MKLWNQLGIGILAVLLLGVPLIAACGGDDEEAGTATPTSQSPTPAAKKVKITIGNHTDLTGPAAVPMEAVNAGLDDVVRHYNENNLIPGIEVEVLKYDGALDPSKDIPGWEWLKERGADIIVAWFMLHPVTMGPLAERDRIPFFVANAPSELLQTPGYMFATAPASEDLMWNLITWVMENDWDYPSKGPAKVGLAADQGGDPARFSKAFEKYAALYPERMKWMGAQVNPVGNYQWATAVEALKDCDYIYPPNLWPMFVKDYVAAGYSKTKFIFSDSHMSYFKIGDSMNLWPKIDGGLFICQSEWWGEEAEYVRFSEQLMNRYRSGSVKELQSDKGYNAVANGILMLEAIRNAAAAVGPENVGSQAIYEGAQSVTITFDGIQRFSFTPTKRVAVDRLAMYEADGTGKRAFRISEWFPLEALP